MSSGDFLGFLNQSSPYLLIFQKEQDNPTSKGESRRATYKVVDILVLFHGPPFLDLSFLQEKYAIVITN